MTNPPEWNASLADVLIGCELDMFICTIAKLIYLPQQRECFALAEGSIVMSQLPVSLSQDDIFMCQKY